jgi:hypothetical protein
MPANISTALKVVLEGAGLGVAVYRRRVPSSATMPYIVITEALAATTGYRTTIETIQLDLYQAETAEVEALPDRVTTTLLRTRGVNVGDSVAHLAAVSGAREIPDEDGVLRHSWSATTGRELRST